MTDELTAREHIEHLHLLTQRPSLYLDRSLSIALDDYRAAIVAATKAEHEAKLAAERREPSPTFEARLSAVELANTVLEWCEGGFRDGVPFAEVTRIFRARVAALEADAARLDWLSARITGEKLRNFHGQPPNIRGLARTRLGRCHATGLPRGHESTGRRELQGHGRSLAR